MCLIVSTLKTSEFNATITFLAFVDQCSFCPSISISQIFLENKFLVAFELKN